MTLGFENAQQLRQLLLSCGMGFLLGLYYEIFRLLRHALGLSRSRVFLGDCVYAATSAVAVFLFSLALNGGVLRWYMGLGLLVGFFAYRRTMGAVLLKTVLFLLRSVERITQKNSKLVVAFVGGFFQKAKAFLGSKFSVKNRKKF